MVQQNPMNINKIHHLYDLIQYKSNHFDKVKSNKMFAEDIHINDLNNLVDKDIDHQHQIMEHMCLFHNNFISIFSFKEKSNHYFDMDFLDRMELVFHKILQHILVHINKFQLEIELKYMFHYVDMENDYKMLYFLNHVHKMVL